MRRVMLGAFLTAGLLAATIGAALGAGIGSGSMAAGAGQCSKFHMLHPDIQPTAADFGRCARPYLQAVEAPGPR